MKNLSLKISILISAIFIVLISCSDDDSVSPTTTANANLEGTVWALKSRVATNCVDASNNENITCTSSCQAIILNSDGTLDIANEDGIMTASYTKSGSMLMVAVGPNTTLDINYAILGNTLTVTFKEDSCDVTEVYNVSSTLPLTGTKWVKYSEVNANCTNSSDNCNPCNGNDQTIELNANGAGTSVSQDTTTNFTYTTNGDKFNVELTENGQIRNMEFKYYLFYNILSLNYKNEDGCDVTEIYKGS